MLQKSRPKDGATSGLHASNLRFEMHETLTAIDRAAWDACFENPLEGYDYLLAVEQSALADFEWRYATITRAGQLVAAAPVFLCDYRLETTLERGRLTGLIEKTRTAFPRFLSLKLACMGSPCTECTSIGIHHDIPNPWREDLLARLLDSTTAWAQRSGFGLFALKDVPLPLDPALSKAIDGAGLVAMDSLPTAWLHIDFPDIDTYIARLSAGTRKDIRRKMRVTQQVTVEMVTELGDLLPRFMELYQDTRNRSNWKFEDLTPDYFTRVLENMRGNAFCNVYRVGDEVLAFNLLLRDGNRLVDKFFCMDAEQGRAYNLYYLSWLENIRFCLAHRLTRYQSGQASYQIKLRLGSSLTDNAMFFKHRNRFLHAMLRLVSPLFGSNGMEPKQ
jgi:uncharacterized protein